MTVASGYSREEYAGDGSQTDFAYNFRILDADHLKVYTINDTTSEETVLTRGVDYTVSGVNDYSGGTVSLSSAPASGVTLVIERETPVSQPADYKNQGAFYGESHESSFDRLTFIAQEQAKAIAAITPSADEVYEPGSEPTAGLANRGRIILVRADGESMLAKICLKSHDNTWSWVTFAIGSY